MTDTHNGFRGSPGPLPRLKIQQTAQPASEPGPDCRARLRYVEVPVTIRYAAEVTAKGQSSWNAVAIVVQYFLGRLVR